MSTGQEAAPEELNLSTPEGPKCSENPLYLNEKFSDVIFLVGGEKLHAHKAILALKSKYFTDLFDENCDKKEITILSTSPESFRSLLKYIYTGTIIVPSDIELMLQILVLAHQNSFGDLESNILKKIESILDANNLILFLNGANAHDLDDLRNVCHSFIDADVLQLLKSDSLNDLTQTSLLQILKRDTFLAPEVDIFKSVAKWCEKNNNNLVLECVRLSLLTVPEIMSIVWPTKLVSPEKLLETISGIIIANGSSKNVGHFDTIEDIETVRYKTNVVSHTDCAGLSTDAKTDVKKDMKHIIDGETGIVFRLNRSCTLNHIRMKLYDADNRYCSYYIETSRDQKNWHRIIDYGRYACRSVQKLYFAPQEAQYIKVVGTSTTVGNDFHLVMFEALYKSKIPRIQDGIIVPDANVATPEKGAMVLGGRDRQCLLDGNHNNCSYYYIDSNKSGGIIVQLSQPYAISSIRLLLDDYIHYGYFIETSVNKTDWDIAIDRRTQNCTSWQYLQFEERVVVFIKITGIRSSAYNWFCCYHFESPSKVKK